jgi:hypothetical protein
VESGPTERLIALLHAQREEASLRAGLARDTVEWVASSDRLDGLNDQIIQTGPSGNAPGVLVGDGLELELDSRPVEDGPFRREVVATVRQAIVVLARQRAARRSLGRLTPAEQGLSKTRRLIAAAETALHARYPAATISSGRESSEPDTLALRADRDGRLA